VTQLDPTSDFDALKKVQSVRVLGQEVIAGITTTHYATHLDLPLFGDVFGPGAGRGAPYELWVDDHGLPAKYKVSTKLPGIRTLVIAGTFTDWGHHATVNRPPASTVVKAETLR
jgi:hypothetical protein